MECCWSEEHTPSPENSAGIHRLQVCSSSAANNWCNADRKSTSYSQNRGPPPWAIDSTQTRRKVRRAKRAITQSVSVSYRCTSIIAALAAHHYAVLKQTSVSHVGQENLE